MEMPWLRLPWSGPKKKKKQAVSEGEEADQQEGADDMEVPAEEEDATADGPVFPGLPPDLKKLRPTERVKTDTQEALEGKLFEVRRILRQFRLENDELFKHSARRERVDIAPEVKLKMVALKHEIESQSGEWVPWNYGPDGEVLNYVRPRVLRLLERHTDHVEEAPHEEPYHEKVARVREQLAEEAVEPERSSPPDYMSMLGRFSAYAGKLSEGGDLFIGVMTIEAAKAKVLTLPTCKGFTCASDDVDGPTTIYFKGKFDLHDEDGWMSYRADFRYLKGDPVALEDALSIAMPAYYRSGDLSKQDYEELMELRKTESMQRQSIAAAAAAARTRPSAKSKSTLASRRTRKSGRRITTRSGTGTEFMRTEAGSDSSDFEFQ